LLLVGIPQFFKSTGKTGTNNKVKERRGKNI
jgi:hypothetical protein